LSPNKEASLSATALAEVKEGRGKEDLRCRRLFSQIRRGLSEDEETKLE